MALVTDPATEPHEDASAVSKTSGPDVLAAPADEPAGATAESAGGEEPAGNAPAGPAAGAAAGSGAGEEPAGSVPPAEPGQSATRADEPGEPADPGEPAGGSPGPPGTSAEPEGPHAPAPQQAVPVPPAPPRLYEDPALWGRVDEDGTVYLRTATGERAVGSWHAGSPEEGLAYYGRRYDDLATEVDLLEHRVEGSEGELRSVRHAADRLRQALPTAHAVGDLDALGARLAAILDRLSQRHTASEAAKAAEAAKAVAAKQDAVAEAERLAETTDWKAAGDRFREIVEWWRTVRIDRKTDSELWRRLMAARDEFTRRRGAHFAALDDQRKAAQAKKEALVAEAEKLSSSTEWATTASRLKAMMSEWKAAGRAHKAADDALWTRFRAAQDAFFTHRSATFNQREEAYRSNLKVKEGLLAEAEALDPSADLPAAQRRLRDIERRWDVVGKVPREAVASLERRLEAAAQRVRTAADTKWRREQSSQSPLVIRLRESVAKLEARAERARSEGRTQDAEKAEAQLATQREWLAQAERSRR